MAARSSAAVNGGFMREARAAPRSLRSGTSGKSPRIKASAKRDATLVNRGLDFTDARDVFAGPVFERIDDRFDYGATRRITIGRLRGRMVVLVWTLRGAARHKAEGAGWQSRINAALREWMTPR
jgi:uncharacterized protein